MKTSSLEILESTLPPDQARAILRVMEQKITDRDDSLVKKGELHAVEEKIHALELKVEAVRGEIKGLGTKLVIWMFGMTVASTGLLLTVLTRVRS